MMLHHAARDLAGGITQEDMPMPTSAINLDTSHHYPKEGRLFWPAAFVDEFSPPGESDPQAWIVKDEAGTYWLRDKTDDDPEGGLRMEEGEEVQFFYEEDRRSASVDFDGTTMTSGAELIPAHHNSMWNGDLEIAGDNIEDVTRQLIAGNTPAGTIDLDSAFHNTVPVWFKFSARFGGPRLVPMPPPDEPTPEA